MKGLKRIMAAVCGIFVLLILPQILVSCHTNESNYRRAYLRAKELRDSMGEDSTIYTRIRREATMANAVIDGDSLLIRRERVRITEGQDAVSPNRKLLTYNVVVAQFKQVFHARSLCKRFVNAGYPGAFIIETAEPLYYVVACSTDDISSARDTLNQLRDSSPIRLNDGFPMIIRPA